MSANTCLRKNARPLYRLIVLSDILPLTIITGTPSFFVSQMRFGQISVSMMRSASGLMFLKRRRIEYMKSRGSDCTTA